MLHVTRKIGESLVINDTIEVSVLDIKGKTVKLGVEFPETARVYRRELYEKIKKQNIAAAQSTALLEEEEHHVKTKE